MKRTPLSAVFMTVMVDLIGFGIVIPLLPLYAQQFGASGLQVGLLMTIYSAAQLVAAPLWGRLSRRCPRSRGRPAGRSRRHPRRRPA
jgi:DHA1 family tetracycline resistance protein-like MFS transporter